MRVPAFSFARKLLLAAAVGLLACGLALPCAPAFAEGDAAPPALLASSLTDGSASFVREDVSLATFEDDAAPEPIIGSFTADGLTYAARSGEAVALVAVDATSPLIERDGEDGFLQVPASVSFGGFDYAVSAVGCYAFYLSGVTDVMLPASVIDVDDRAFRSSDVASVEVAEGGSTYSSFDGALYDADQSSLLLIPEGKQGTVLLCKTTASAAPSVFSHCPLVTQIAVEEGSAAFASENGLLYDASLETLLRVPAGATEIVIRDGCTSVVAGSMEGCTKLESIEAPASVTEVHEPFLSSGAEASLQAGGVVALSLSDQPDASDKQGADSAAEALASAVSVTLPASAEVGPWKQAGFWIEASQSDGQPEMLSEDVPLSTGVDEPVGPIASTQSAATANATTREIPYRVFGPNRLYVSIEPSGTKYPYVYKESYYSLDYEDYSDTLFNGRTGYSQAFTFSSNDSDVWTTTWLSQTHFPDDVAFQKTTPTINGVTASAQKDYLHLYIQKRSDATQAHCWIGTSGSTKSGALFPYGVTRVRVVERGAGAKWTPDNLTITDTTSPQKVSLKSDTATVRIFLNGCMQSKVTWKKSASDSTAYTTTLVDPYGTPNVPTTPTLSGYTFAGWEDTSGNLVASSTATKTNTSVFGDVTYIARWTKNPVYTITLNKNGGSGGTSTMYEWYGKGWYTTSSPTDSSTTATSITAPTRTGYSFKGYSTSSTATYGSYWTSTTSMPSNTAFSSHTTLYAVWQKNPVYAITLNSNGGPGDAVTIYEWYGKGWYSTSNPTDSTAALDRIYVQGRDGYTFKGYSTSSTATSGSYWTSTTSMPSNTAFSSHTTLYAVWQKNPVYTITLNPNGGSGGTSTVYLWFDKGWYSTPYPTDSSTALDRIYVQGRDGYTFKGYSTSSTATSGDYWTSATTMPSSKSFYSNTTLYAVWQQNSVYAITLDPNGGSGGTSTVYQWYGKNWYSTSSPTDTSSILDSITAPRRAGYTFKGYSTSSTATSGDYWTSATTMPSSKSFYSNTTLYAVWQKNAISTVNLYMNAGSTTTLYKTIYLWYGKNWYSTSSPTDSSTALTTIGTPSWPGRTYKGFAASSTAATASYWTSVMGFPSNTDSTFGAADTAKTTSLYAVWQGNEVTLTWDPHNGQSVSTTKQTHSTTSTAKVRLPTAPEWEGRVFAGWYTAASGGTQVTNATDLPASNATYHAHWTENSYTISYNYDGGSVSGNPTTYTVASASFTLKNPTRAGYTFAGWSGTGLSGSANTTVTIAKGSTGDRSYTAHWTKSPVRRITLDQQGGLGGTEVFYQWYGKGFYAEPDPVDDTPPLLSIEAPALAGYIYRGYWTDESGGNQMVAGTSLAGLSNVAFSADTTLFASWERSADYEIALDANAGTPDQVAYYWPDMGYVATKGSTDVVEPGDALVNSLPQRQGYMFQGYFNAREGGEMMVGPHGALSEGAPALEGPVIYYAHWAPTISADVLIEVTASVDLLGIEDQVPASGYIESRCGAPLAVEEVRFTVLPGAAELFGEANVASISLEALALAGGASWEASSPTFSFPLSANAIEADATKLAAFRMGAYAERIPISYRFAIPEDVLASIDVSRFSGKTTAVGQVVYAVKLAG